MDKGNKRIINAWAMYDWANSVYFLSLASAIFPVYYLALTSTADGSEKMIDFLGYQVNNGSLYIYAISIAYLFIALISPMLSGIADYTGSKKGFMKFFCYLGSFSCLALYFFRDEDSILFGIIPFMLATIGATGSIVFYNSYLPEIAEESEQDQVSAKGYAMGYIGSVLLLLANLVMIQFPNLMFDIDGKTAELLAQNSALDTTTAGEEAFAYYQGVASRISFVTVGVWWLVFAQISFYVLPGNVYNRKPDRDVLVKGYYELMDVVKQIIKMPQLRNFITSFFWYNMGVQTVIYLASNYGSSELKLDAVFLIGTILVIQLIAIPGAYLFAWLSSKYSNIKALEIAILIWICVSIYAYFITGPVGFLIAGFFVGLVMGGIQALSRSTYSKLLPETQSHASFFSFFDMAEKVAIVLGMATFAFVKDYTGSMRNSVLAVLLFFITGWIFLYLVKKSVGKDLKPVET